MTAPKLCKDCKHYVASGMEVRYDECHRNKKFTDASKAQSLVRGDPPRLSDDRQYCDLQRVHNWLHALMFGKCGAEGRWWEAREAK